MQNRIIKYAVSIGRRQPMHRLHVDCIREIVDAGLMPIIMVGSVNEAGDKFYDPLHNPLTFAEQQEQIRAALPFILGPEIIPVPDVGNLERWCANVVSLLKGRAGECVMHYRDKHGDTQNAAIAPLSASEEVFAKLGLKSWRTTNKNSADDLLTGSELRALPLGHPQLKHDLAAPDYIAQLMQKARRENPDGKLLDSANIPVTMLDITLTRLYREAGIRITALSWQELRDEAEQTVIKLQ